ncbi:hypothetical protein LR48_Vigan07g189900 [Vigna angularis]|uniref:Aminotransferase-like plant mobile domain-containing protein n=1 Tax=Phaseolus angularis TaxID=3914 RepID=A0A0L9UZA6_PHAAN|nr:hypothetical protein LR48_Vigan07g189900 [Vigna angularis]
MVRAEGAALCLAIRIANLVAMRLEVTWSHCQFNSKGELGTKREFYGGWSMSRLSHSDLGALCERWCPSIHNVEIFKTNRSVLGLSRVSGFIQCFVVFEPRTWCCLGYSQLGVVLGHSNELCCGISKDVRWVYSEIAAVMLKVKRIGSVLGYYRGSEVVILRVREGAALCLAIRIANLVAMRLEVTWSHCQFNSKGELGTKREFYGGWSMSRLSHSDLGALCERLKV